MKRDMGSEKEIMRMRVEKNFKEGEEKKIGRKEQREDYTGRNKDKNIIYRTYRE